MKKRGFTFVEVLLVLVILGILSLIIVPSIKKIMPDENKAKVKKAYNTLTNVVESLANDNDVYMDGIFGQDSNGNTINDPTYFCTHFADRVNVSGTIQCAQGSIGTQQVLNYDTSDDAGSRASLDRRCSKRGQDGIAFQTTDGIRWYGMNDNFAEDNSASYVNNGIDTRYVVVCIDTDSNGQASDTVYAFAVRRDGRIIAGSRAQAILDEEKIR